MFDEAFLEVKLQRYLFRFLSKESSLWTLPKQQNKETFFKVATRLYGHRVFFHSANSLTSNTVCMRIVYLDNLSAITKDIIKAISVINKSKLYHRQMPIYVHWWLSESTIKILTFVSFE